MATATLERTRAVRASPNQAKAITGSRASKRTLKLVETMARWRIRWSARHVPPGGVRAEVTAVNPAITTAIWAIPISRNSLGMGAMLPTVTSPDRAALEHENWIAYLTGVGRHGRGVEIERVDGVVAIRSPMPFDWFNQVLVERDGASLSALLAVAGRRPRGGEGPIVRLRDAIDDPFVPGLTNGGWVAAGAEAMTPGMVAFPIDHLAAMPSGDSGFQIRRVTDAGGVQDHRAVVTEGFGVDESVAAGTTALELLDTPECTIYVGYAGGVAVTSGLGWRSGRTIGVYAISTVPAARRRGYGEAMTARVVADGIAAGCDVAVLQASVVGRRIYERLGFRVEVRYDAYLRSAAT
jgi:ribosomal protein S18 acetylase RimI-like enzyme